VADDDPDQEDLSRDAEGCAPSDLNGEGRGDRGAVEFGHITRPTGGVFRRAPDAGLMPDLGAVLAGECRVRACAGDRRGLVAGTQIEEVI